MVKFSDISIVWKTVGLVTVLSSVSIAVAVYSTNRMRHIDDSYGQLLEGYDAANLAMARANRNLVFVDRSIYRVLAEVDLGEQEGSKSERG